MSRTLTEKRCRELMEQAGMPNSRALKGSLFQLENETGQAYEKDIAEMQKELDQAYEGMEYLFGQATNQTSLSVSHWFNEDGTAKRGVR